jgi:hypothetical protein
MIDVTFVRDPLLFYLSVRPFGTVSLDVDRGYLSDSSKLDQYLTVVKRLYFGLGASYGFVNTHEMGQHFDKQGKEYGIAIDLRRALPDIYWANLFGPEYVEMFGERKIMSAPGHRVEKLPDGGVLLTLTSSPFDFDTDRERFENRRVQLKQHLGIEAFDPSDWNPFETADWTHHGRTPNFRFSNEKNTTVIHAAPSSTQYSDELSSVSRNQWDKWLGNNESLAKELVRDMEAKGVKLDFSGDSLKRLDEHLSNPASRSVHNITFLMKLAAYLAQVVIRNTGVTWSLGESSDLPELRVGHIHLSPLARTQKVLSEGETFEHWYQHLVKDLAPATRIRRPN